MSLKPCPVMGSLGKHIHELEELDKLDMRREAYEEEQWHEAPLLLLLMDDMTQKDEDELTEILRTDECEFGRRVAKKIRELIKREAIRKIT